MWGHSVQTHIQHFILHFCTRQGPYWLSRVTWMRNIGKKAIKHEFDKILPRVIIFAIMEVLGSWWSAINTHIDICIIHITQSILHISREFFKTPNAALCVCKKCKLYNKYRIFLENTWFRPFTEQKLTELTTMGHLSHWLHFYLIFIT